jgi:hypothetical protein
MASLGMRREGNVTSSRALRRAIRAIQIILRDGARGAGIRRVQFELSRDYGLNVARGLVADIMRRIDGRGPQRRASHNFKPPIEWENPGK